MKTIKKNYYQIMPWKNGLGMTAQIDKDSNDWWRLSQASIIHPNTQFSEFKNCKRILTILTGDGLKLNDKFIYKNEIFEFSGDLKIECELLGSEVLDLGLIYVADKIRAKMYFINFDQFYTFKNNADISFLYCAEGKCIVYNEYIETGDTVKLSLNSEVRIEAVHSKVKIVVVEIKFLSNPEDQIK